MPPPGPPDPWVDRPEVIARLSSDARVLVLLGPVGSGRTSLLAAWAAAQPDVAWVGDTVPDSATIVVDDAEQHPAALWDELGARLERRPDLRVRIAAHHAQAVPDSWGAEVFDVPYLSAAETEQLLAVHRSATSPTAVVSLTAGHPGSVVTIAAAGSVHPDQLPTVLAAAGATQVLPEDQHALVVTDHLTPELVVRLGRSPAVLDAAEAAGIGRWADRERKVFAYLPHVREATRAARLPDPDADRRLRREAAAHFLELGASPAAFVEAAHADDLELVDAAVRQGGIPLIRGHGRAIAALLGPVSAVRLGRHPTSALALALVLNARREHRLRAVELFGLAVAGARLKPRGTAERALFRVVESVALRVSGLADGGVATAQKATALIDALGPTQRATLSELEGDLHLHTGISLLYGERYAEADEQFERAVRTARRTGQHLAALGGLASSAALRGDMVAAHGRVARAAERRWDQAELDEYPGSLLRVAQAQLAIERGDFAQAGAMIAAIWPIIDTIEHWPLLASLQALVDLHDGPADVALEQFRGVRRLRSSRWSTPDLVRSRLDVTESLLLLATGDLAEARRCVSGGRSASTLMQSARVALWAGDDTHALATLGRVRPATPAEDAVCASLKAVAMRRTGRAHEAAEARATLAELVETRGLRSPLMLLPPEELAHLGDLSAGIRTLLGGRDGAGG